MKISQEIRQQQGIEICKEIQQRLNAIIEEQGSVLLDDPRIWDEFLCRLTNEDWQLIFDIMEQITDSLTPSQSRQIMESVQYFKRHCHKPQCMDRDRKYKKPAWQAIMVIRESFNSIQGFYLPNRSEKATLSSVREKKYASVFE